MYFSSKCKYNFDNMYAYVVHVLLYIVCVCVWVDMFVCICVIAETLVPGTNYY